MLKVTDYHVKCSVMSRYAVTTVQSSVWNQLAITKEAAFEVDLPSSAFISNFTITSNGKVYVAQVKERAAARKIYDAAKKQGKTAGLVATKEREIEKFRVAVSVPSGARMFFSLSYEELLLRRLGRYELSLGLRPGQPVQNLTLDVSITERTGISFIKVFPLKTSRLLSNTAQAKTVVSPSKKTTTTSSPGSTKTAPAPLSGKKPTPSRTDSKTASPPPAGKISTSLLNALKTASPPAPGKISTPQPMKTIPPSTTTTTTMLTFSSSTTPPLSSVRTDAAPLPGRLLTPQPSTVRTALPLVKAAASSMEAENSTTPATGVPQPEITTTALPELLSPLTPPTPAPAPALEDNNTISGVDVDLSIATLVSATFAPMPGVTDGPRLWEAAGLLDYDATYDYDYDLSYDAFDGDPHFVVQLPKLHQNLCFTVDGRANDILRLLEDPKRGLIVDGHLVGAPPKHGSEERPRTYFDRLTISSATGGSGDIMITLSLDAVVVEGEGQDILPINQQGSVTRQGVTVAVDNHRSCWIELAKDVRFLVLFHHYKHPSYLQMAHLGFYITHGRGLSALTQGLLGQFQHADMSITAVNDHPDGGAHRANKEGMLAKSGILRWGSEHMPVTLQDKTLKDTVRKRHLGKCWVVPKAEVERLLGHPYESYVVDQV
eukprot:superscaffoldBa00001938_g12581